MKNIPAFLRLESTRSQLTIILTTTILYVASFKLLLGWNGPVIAALITIPVAVSGWFFGPLAGLAAGGLAILINAVLFFWVEGTTGLVQFAMNGWAGNLMMLAAGYSLGRLGKKEGKKQEQQLNVQANSRDRFISLVSIVTKDILDPKIPEEKYYFLVTHLANLFVADYAYILSWDAAQKEMKLLISTREIEKPFTNITLVTDVSDPGRFLLTGRQALVIDEQQKAPYPIDFSSINKLSIPAGAELAVPLMTGAYKFGIVIYGFSSSRTFYREDLLYAQLVASQTALALWTSEKDSTIKKQLAEANSLRKIAHALSETEQIGIETVLQIIVDSAKELITAAEHVTLHMIDEERQLLISRAVAGKRKRESGKLNLRIGEGIAGRVALARKSLNIADVEKEPLFSFSDAEISFRSLIVTPIQGNEQCLGTISIDSQQVNAFSLSDAELLDALGTQAAIAIENAILIEKTREDLREINSLYQITRDLAATLDYEQLIQNTTDLLVANFGFYHVQVFITEPPNNTLVMLHASGQNASLLQMQGNRLPIGEGIVGHVAEVGEPFVTNNVDEVVFFKRNPLLPETQSELCAPIKVDNRVLGVLDIQEVPPRMLTQRQLKLTTAIADQLAVALQKASLYKDLQHALRKEEETRMQLIQAERLSVVGRLLASVSHELNNPIQAIQNALFLIRGDEKLSEQSRQDLEIILDETERMSLLLSKLRNAYRSTRAKDFKDIDINHIIEDVFTLIATFVRNKHISLNFHPYMNLPKVPAIEEQIRQVILNIVMNSIEAMSEGGQLTIVTDHQPENKWVLIRFSDTGPGIQGEIFPNIFDAFVTNKSAGTGLGLTISQEIIQKHNGQISAENNPDGGATFRIWLPTDTENQTQHER